MMLLCHMKENPLLREVVLLAEEPHSWGQVCKSCGPEGNLQSEVAGRRPPLHGERDGA